MIDYSEIVCCEEYICVGWLDIPGWLVSASWVVVIILRFIPSICVATISFTLSISDDWNFLECCLRLKGLSLSIPHFFRQLCLLIECYSLQRDQPIFLPALPLDGLD